MPSITAEHIRDITQADNGFVGVYPVTVSSHDVSRTFYVSNGADRTTYINNWSNNNPKVVSNTSTAVELRMLDNGESGIQNGSISLYTLDANLITQLGDVFYDLDFIANAPPELSEPGPYTQPVASVNDVIHFDPLGQPPIATGWGFNGFAAQEYTEWSNYYRPANVSAAVGTRLSSSDRGRPWVYKNMYLEPGAGGPPPTGNPRCVSVV